MIDPIELKPTSKASLYKVIRMPVGSRKQIVFKLTDSAGKPIDLTVEPLNEPAPEPDFNGQTHVTEMTVSVRLRGKEEYGSPAIFDIVGTILPDGDCKGAVEFIITKAQARRAGVYLCEVGRFAGDFLIDTWPVYVLIEPSVFDSHCSSGPLTIPEIRLEMSDMEIDDVSLLDDLEFKDVEILHAIRSVVDLWNETPPDVDSYTAKSFPFRHHWIKGTVAKLYSIAAKKYLRNELEYSAGGIAINDKRKYDQYGAISREMMTEFMDWMVREKRRQNWDRGWSTGL